MDSQFQLSASNSHDIHNESSGNVDNKYFDKVTTGLMSPGLNLSDKENLTSAMDNLSIKQKPVVDLTKCQKGAQPGGIGDFSKLSFFNRNASKAAQKSRRRSQQIVIEPEPPKPKNPEAGRGSGPSNPTPKPPARRLSNIPVPTKPVENRRRSNVNLPPSQMVLRPRTTSSETSTSSSTSVLSQRQAPKASTTPSQLQKPVTRRSLLQPAPPSTFKPGTRRQSHVEPPKPEVPQPPKPARRPSLFANLPPFSLQMLKSASTKEQEERVPKQEPILSRRYYTRSTQRQPS